MTPDDVTAGHRLSREAGWNQREEDWRLLLSLDAGRFLAATLDGEVVGVGGAACYGATLAWVCMILVDPARRGQGIGTRIVQGVLDRLGDVERVGLDATPAGRPVYLRLGFLDASRLLRMEARPKDVAPPRSSVVTPLANHDLEAVLEMDRDVFGADRAAVLRWAFARSGAWWARNASGIAGYGFTRPGQHSFHVGPVVARDVETAGAIVAAALAARDGERVLVDVPADAGDWSARLAGLGFREQRPLVRMFRGDARPPGRPELQLAIMGPEFG